MLPEIAQINGNICDFEKVYGVTIDRETATLQTDNNMSSMFMLVNQWVIPTFYPNKRVVGLTTVTDLSTSKCGLGLFVMSFSGSVFTGYEVWDINKNVIDSGTISTKGPVYDGGPQTQAEIIRTTYKNVIITKDTTNNTFRVRATQNISFLWGLFDIDIADIDITFDATTLQPIP